MMGSILVVDTLPLSLGGARRLRKTNALLRVVAARYGDAARGFQPRSHTRVNTDRRSRAAFAAGGGAI